MGYQAHKYSVLFAYIYLVTGSLSFTIQHRSPHSSIEWAQQRTRRSISQLSPNASMQARISLNEAIHKVNFSIRYYREVFHYYTYTPASTDCADYLERMRTPETLQSTLCVYYCAASKHNHIDFTSRVATDNTHSHHTRRADLNRCNSKAKLLSSLSTVSYELTGNGLCPACHPDQNGSFDIKYGMEGILLPLKQTLICARSQYL